MTLGQDVYVYGAMLGFGLMGIGAIVKPDVVTRQFDIPTLSVLGRNEVRAVYGGFGLAMTGMLGYALITPSIKSGVLTTIAVALLGMASGRLISIMIDRRLAATVAFYTLLEIGVAVGLWQAQRA